MLIVAKADWLYTTVQLGLYGLAYFQLLRASTLALTSLWVVYDGCYKYCIYDDTQNDFCNVEVLFGFYHYYFACNEYACVSVREDIPRTIRAIFTNFLRMLTMVVAQSSSGRVINY